MSATTMMNSPFLFVQTTTMMTSSISSTNTDISPIACLAFTILILATVGGNSLVLLALLLDKRLHSPSFYLIANMAMADLLLGKRNNFSSNPIVYFKTHQSFRPRCITIFICSGIIEWSMDLWTRFLLSMVSTRCTLLYCFNHGSHGCVHWSIYRCHSTIKLQSYNDDSTNSLFNDRCLGSIDINICCTIIWFNWSRKRTEWFQF